MSVNGLNEYQPGDLARFELDVEERDGKWCVVMQLEAPGRPTIRKRTEFFKTKEEAEWEHQRISTEFEQKFRPHILNSQKADA